MFRYLLVFFLFVSPAFAHCLEGVGGECSVNEFNLDIVKSEGRMEFDAGVGFVNPRLLISDQGHLGVLVPGKPNHPNNVAGVSVMGGGINGRFALNIVNDGSLTTRNNGQALLSIWGRGDSDIGIEIYQSDGTVWQPLPTQPGRQLGKLAGFGHTGEGFAQNESARIGIYATQTFDSNGQHPTAEVTSAGAAVVIHTTPNGSNYPQPVGGFTEAGSFMIGLMSTTGNQSRAGPGVLELKEATMPSNRPQPGRAFLFLNNNRLYVWYSNRGSPEQFR